MAKIEREKVVVEASYYNFDERYENVMSHFEDKQVISINLISSKPDGDYMREEYLVFYRDVSEDDSEDTIERGDLVYIRDVNSGERLYETVEKVVFEDNENKCYTVDQFGDRGWTRLSEVTLVAKKNDRKDI